MHLIKRFVQSLSTRDLDAHEVEFVGCLLSPGELRLWNAMSLPDRRHSLKVLDRFVSFLPDATRGERVGVALHDVGKIESGLGTCGRVLATIVGPRTKRFVAYHDHEAIGARLLRECGSDEDALGILESTGRPAAIEAYRRADHY